MSHEIRTPLNSMMILAQMLAANEDKSLSDKQQEWAATIHSAGRDLLVLINLLREIAVRDRRRDGGDIPNLGREIARQPIHAVGGLLPHAGHAANVRLRAQFAFGPHLAGDAITSAEKDRSWSTVALIAFVSSRISPRVSTVIF
jgi:signal transduction histidine kinase